MKVYKPGSAGLHRVFVQPGVHHPEKSDWMTKQGTNEDGKDILVAKMFTVEFKDGVAEVDSQLGRYMLDRGLAEKSPLIMPQAGLAVA